MFSLTAPHVRKTEAGCVTRPDVRHGTTACQKKKEKKKNGEHRGEGVNTKWRNWKEVMGGRKDRQLPSAAEPLKGPPNTKESTQIRTETTNAEMTVL